MLINQTGKHNGARAQALFIVNNTWKVEKVARNQLINIKATVCVCMCVCAGESICLCLLIIQHMKVCKWDTSFHVMLQWEWAKTAAVLWKVCAFFCKLESKTPTMLLYFCLNAFGCLLSAE